MLYYILNLYYCQKKIEIFKTNLSIIELVVWALAGSNRARVPSV